MSLFQHEAPYDTGGVNTQAGSSTHLCELARHELSQSHPRFRVGTGAMADICLHHELEIAVIELVVVTQQGRCCECTGFFERGEV